MFAGKGPFGLAMTDDEATRCCHCELRLKKWRLECEEWKENQNKRRVLDGMKDEIRGRRKVKDFVVIVALFTSAVNASIRTSAKSAASGIEQEQMTNNQWKSRMNGGGRKVG